MSRWITVIYKCRCMKSETGMHMQEREPGEDIEDFMDRMTNAMAALHLKHHPMCQETKMEYVKIPAADGIGVGTGGTA